MTTTTTTTTTPTQAFSFWSMCSGLYRVQISDPDAAKKLKRSKAFSLSANSTAGDFLRVFTFAARDRREAKEIIEQYLKA